MANKKIQVGTRKIAIFQKEKDGKTFYTFQMQKSFKDEAGNWKNSSISGFPEDFLIFYQMMTRIMPFIMPITEFELKPKETPIDDAQVAAEIGDDIPF